ncbi:MAG: TRIC cation channel family protein, partial [Leptotrichiaceae bacterium]|nr:TRIC cation channel family protein [Leptotrichiaceae bacterium]MBP9876366.1 TRIC cation channel family protein [Leptotrichiaceae bacterium]
GIGVIATITGIGGGMMRDILANEVPYILKEDIYATLAFGGGILYYLLIFNLGFSRSFAIVIVFVILLTIRLLAMKYKLNLRNASADKYRS